MLVPLRRDGWDDLVASGRVTPPAADGDVADEAPGDYGIDASGTLRSMRDIER